MQRGLDLSSAERSPLEGLTSQQIADRFSQVLAGRLHGLCFSPYAKGQVTGDALSEQQIRHRLDVVAPSTQWIRTFSSTEGHELIPRLARAKGLKTMVGAWIGHDRDRNEREIQALAELAAAGLVDIATVGNEVLLRDELSEQELLGYLRRVRALLPAHVPVGCVDAYSQFLDRPALTEACDVLLPNCYPFWEGADIAHASQHLQHMHALVQEAARGKKVIVTETGWPGKGQAVSAAVPSRENAMRYFIETQEWARRAGVELFYFSSFDEPWKLGQEGEVGTQWGLWDKDEQPKYGV
jgi:GPH family glycoside/pentoside/hexuronide:cation symporter